MTSENGTGKATPEEAIAFPDELERLSYVQTKLRGAIAQAEKTVKKYVVAYRDNKKYVSDSKGELDPQEIFENERMQKEIDSRGAFAAENLRRLERLWNSPYFARIDFREESKNVSERFYIGSYAFMRDDELLISDWRSPVAGMFYDCEVGPAGYVSPDGPVEGTLTRKRQFKFINGVMEYALETSDNIRDDILSLELSRTSDEKMKSIIATIQKEQNAVIRNEKSGTIIIQGVAGSGKTSIALHRIAYLLYRYKKDLTAKNVAIVSPNKAFGEYISGVLPELGEEPIYELGFGEIASAQLGGKLRFSPEKDPLEEKDPRCAERSRFKSTYAFLERMDAYLAGMPERVFSPADLRLGEFVINRDYIENRYASYRRHPVLVRLKMIAADIRERLELSCGPGEPLPPVGAVFKKLTGMLKIKTALALYEDFYASSDFSDMFVTEGKSRLEWDDVFPYLYFKAAFEGLKVGGKIRHLVIDEMQDYTPAQYAVMNILFPCRKTILGDFGQTINPNHENTLADLRALYPDSEFVELNKSYRSTYEIIMFAKKIQNVAALEPAPRHGDEPELIRCGSRDEEFSRITEKIDAFRKSGNASLGIIVKTNAEAKALYAELSRSREVAQISPEHPVFRNGVSVASIRMSKGLEFDEVVIPFANAQNYGSESDRGLLYIAVTRAMHRLALTYTGEPSPLIRK